MKKIFYIAFLLLCFAGMSYAARTKATGPVPVQLTAEEQCFRYYFYDAHRSMKQGDYLRAFASFLFLEQKDSADAATQEKLGILCQAVSADLALKHYRKAYENEPEAYWENYALFLYDQQPKDAIRILEQSLKRMPDNRDVLETLVSAYSAQGDWKKAIRTQEHICYLEGLTPYNVMPLYRLYVSANQHRKALQVLDDYLEENPEDYRYQSFRGDVLLSLGEREQALRLYHEEEQRHPDNPYVLLSLADYAIRTGDTIRCQDYVIKAIRSDAWEVEQKIQTLQNAGPWLSRQKGLTGQILQELVQAYPLSEQVYEAMDKYYFLKGDYAKSKEALRQMTDIYPDNSRAWGRWLQVLQADSATTGAEFEYVIRNGYLHKGGDRQWYYWMASLLLAGQEQDSAIVVAEEGVRLTVTNADDTRYRFLLLSMLGDLYMNRGDLSSCYTAYEEALQLSPDNVYLLNNYAYTLAVNGGDLRKAERMSRKTIEKEPTNATYLDTYAWILHLQGQDFLAEFYIKRALENQEAGTYDPALQEHYEAILHK